MSEIARWLARIIWWRMLLFQRIPWVRRFRRGWLRKIPDSTARRMVRQDRFARRHGLAILTFSMTLVLASLALTVTYLVALEMLNAGLLRPRK